MRSPLLVLATENAELRAQLAEVQDHCVELAVDAGEMHAEVEALRRELAEIRADRDAWRTKAVRARGGLVSVFAPSDEVEKTDTAGVEPASTPSRAPI